MSYVFPGFVWSINIFYGIAGPAILPRISAGISGKFLRNMCEKCFLWDYPIGLLLILIKGTTRNPKF
jgi:hypothetical protein